jgi:hypothetical protein
LSHVRNPVPACNFFEELLTQQRINRF